MTHMVETQNPVFVIGRQHSGNTMLTSILDRHSRVHGFLNEDRFFEHLPRFSTPLTDRDLDHLTDILADAHLPPIPSEDRPTIRERLARAAQQDESMTAVSLYADTKGWLASRADAQRWAQKATSYVFHIEDLLEAIPDARLIFLMRNPLDIAASLRIRKSASHWLRMAVGWRRGIARAERLQRTYPDHLKIVRYEKLVRSPRSVLSKILSFCGLDFEEDILSVTRINPAENPFGEREGKTGISDDKVHYFPQHLSSTEQRVVLAMISRNFVLDRYPELTDYLPHNIGAPLWARWRFTLMGLGHIIGDLSRRVVRDPAGTLMRFGKRVG